MLGARRASCARVLERFLGDDGGARTYNPLPARADGKTPRYVQTGSQWCAAHVCVIALVAEALVELEGQRPTPVVQAAAEFIRRRQTADGYWESFWSGAIRTAAFATGPLASRSETTRCAVAAVVGCAGAEKPAGAGCLTAGPSAASSGRGPCHHHTAIAATITMARTTARFFVIQPEPA